MARKFRGPVGANIIQPIAPEPEGGFFEIQGFEHGGTVYKLGEKLDKVFLLKAGRVRLTRPKRGGGNILVAILKPGDVFGELFKGEDIPMLETANVDPGSEIWGIAGPDFRKQLELRPELALDVMKAYSERIRSQKQSLWGHTTKDAIARLAEVLLHLAETAGGPCEHGGGREVRGVIQQEIADLTGATRALVSTFINEMKRDGVLGNANRTTLCILDMEALRWLAKREKFAA